MLFLTVTFKCQTSAAWENITGVGDQGMGRTRQKASGTKISTYN